MADTKFPPILRILAKEQSCSDVIAYCSTRSGEYSDIQSLPSSKNQAEHCGLYFAINSVLWIILVLSALTPSAAFACIVGRVDGAFVCQADK